MENEIYKKMPILNTLGINVNQYAPDNNALMFAKALTKIGAGVAEQWKESEFNSKVAQINQLELDFKNKTLVNKDIDLQDPVKREEIFKIANEVTEAQKKAILDYKYLDSDDIQKLEGILKKSTGERAFNLQNDTNKIMIQQETNFRVDETMGAIDHIEQADINSVVDNSYEILHNNVSSLKKLGMNEIEISKTIYNNVVKAETYRLNRELETQLMGENVKYRDILKTFNARKSEILSDEYLDGKVDKMLENFVGTAEEKSRARAYFKDNLKVEYEKTFAGKREWVMSQYEAQLEREQNQKNFLLQYELDQERLDFEKRSDAEKATQGYIDRGDLLGGLSSSVGYPVTTATLLTDSNKLFRKATNWEIKDAVRELKYAEIISPDKVNYLDGEKKNVYARGQGIDSFISGYLSGEMNSLPSYDGKELYIRNASAKGLAPYGLLKAYYINDKDYRTMANLVTFIDTHKGEAKNFLDLAQSENNAFSNYITKTLGMNTIEQKALSDWISAMAQTNGFDSRIVIPNNGDFTRNVTNYYLTNEDFRREVQNAAKLIQKTYNQPKFGLLPINTDIVKESGDRAVQNSQQTKVYTEVSNKGRTNAGTTKTVGGNKNSNKGNSNSKNTYQKTETKDGRKVNFIKGL